jgi:hypothetical protein
MAACEEFVRVACVEAKNNGQPYSDEDTPSISDFADMDKYYQDLVVAHCEENGIGLDGFGKSEAYHTGFEAATQGEPREANPYAECTFGYDEWFAGWDAN